MEHAVDPLAALATKLLGPLTGHKGVDHLPKRHLTKVTGRCRFIQGGFCSQHQKSSLKATALGAV